MQNREKGTGCPRFGTAGNAFSIACLKKGPSHTGQRGGCCPGYWFRFLGMLSNRFIPCQGLDLGEGSRCTFRLSRYPSSLVPSTRLQEGIEMGDL
ncbi:hypothetical protein TNCV_4684861 [Trichonephila clavipes]|nr:hypothetical protein TNCV_4684861 [Trichonephila clavipes]